MRLIAKFAVLVLAACCGVAQAHDPSHEHAANASAPPAAALGRLDFPTSTRSAPAQAAFVEGMLYLHVFEYSAAARAFQRAEALDPGFAMAYWGEAMTYTHPVWNQQDLAAGRAALAKLAPSPEARAAKAGTERERAFLHVTELMYGEGDKRTRDAQVLAAMEAMAKRWPADDEVQLFLSLALLGADEGVRNVPRFLRAAEIAKAVYRHNPQHPGAAHYWIHGMDDPVHAQGALEAAQALAKIAPGAGHSQHMTSHIFMALGRWDDVVASNLAAIRVVNEDLHAKGQPTAACGHYPEWLQYAYFQQGREQEGFGLLRDCQAAARGAIAWLGAHPGEVYLGSKDVATLTSNLQGSLARMRAATIFESPQFRQQASGFDATLGAAGSPSGQTLFADGLQEAWSDEPARARLELASLRNLAAAPGEAGDNGLAGQYEALMAELLQGVIAQHEGRGQAGVRRVAAAADAFDKLPFDFGPPALGLPPRELLGQMLLDAGRKKEALAQFELALKSAPNRRQSVLGRERAATR